MKNKNIIKNYIIGPYPSNSYKTKIIALTLCIITFILSCSVYLSSKNLLIVNDLFKNPIQYTAMKNSSLESPLILSDQENLHSINLKAIDVEKINKDMLDTFLEKIPKVLIFKVLTSSLAVTVLLYGVSEYLLNRISYRPFTAVCYISGIISFEVLVRYSNINEILNLLIEFKIYKRNKK